ncbi:hypothetical protein [Vibrio cortegadensis]|uniref:Lipoprotein n=1 Tax=Vibrio cortegadensis TaxID=1328770 RepID=A0ABV4M3D3_9VIBR
MIKQYMVILIATLLLSGCAEHVAERTGTQIDVVPVTYSLALKIKPQQHKAAQDELDEFIANHWKLIVDQEVTLVWRTNLGQKWAKKTRTSLIKNGVDEKQIAVTQANAGFGERFDFEIKTRVHKAIVSICDYAAVGHHGETNDGCYSDNARWQSMVNPENMLNQSLNAENVNK